MLLTAGIVVLGVAWGIERWNKILMPMLLVLLIVLVVRSVTLDGAREGVYWLLRPDFSQLSMQSSRWGSLSAYLGMGADTTQLPRPGKHPRSSIAPIALPCWLAWPLSRRVWFLNPRRAVFPPAGKRPWRRMFFFLLSIAARSAISLLEAVVVRSTLN